VKVLIDSNVLISAVYNPSSKPARAVRDVCENHELLLCDNIVEECYDVIGRKFPQHIPVLDELLATLRYSSIVAPRSSSVQIEDSRDAPILDAAVIGNADIIISGDNHFLSLELGRPKVLTPAQYLKMMNFGEAENVF